MNIQFLSDREYGIIKKFHRDIPINITGMARAFSISIRYDKINRAGFIQKTKFGYEIVVNQEEAITRQRFTIAHEIAHYLLHKDDTEDNSINRGLNAFFDEEGEADQMAADLLMPLELIDRVVGQRDINSAKQLAEELQVSEKALQIRLK